MILNFIRILLLVFLILAILIDIEVPPILTSQVHQLLIAIFIISIIVVFDEIIGFLLGLIFLIVYFKHYQKIINKTNNSDLNEPLIKAYNPYMMNNIDKFSDDIKPSHNTKTENIPNSTSVLNESTNCLIMPYISTELLDKAQNNIYDNDNYYKEIKNIDNAYGVQGLNSDKTHYLAFDKNNIDNNY
jgi:hypothetical protein